MCRRLLLGGTLLVAGLGIYSCSDAYDLGEKQPEGLNNIYGYMKEQGNFSNYLQLIEDLGQAEILSKTGSKTMFIADDDAFAKFYASNSWGVKNYGELSLAQKKLLLNSSMIDNPYSTSMLSSAESQGSSGRPVKGEVCRRASSQSLLDSVTLVTVENADILPKNAAFAELTANHDSIVLFTDASHAAPMIHFTGKFVTTNKLELSDIDFIYNQRGTGTFKTDDVYVNNSKVINSNIFCKNGFIHQVDNVIMPLDNMAELIRKNPQTQIFSSILERFAAPKDSIALARTYNQNKGTEYDSVFVKRYFSDRSWGSTMSNSVPFLVDKNGKPFDDGNTSLKFDPGWNGYVPYISNDRQPLMEDMAIMLVPTDAAVEDWWNNKDGQVIKDYYGTIENTPNSVLDDLIRVNQLESFAASVPSKFDGGVLNDANEPLGITMDDVDSVYIGCNGLVFLTNKVFAPTSYSSVLFPAVIDTTNYKIIANAITNMNYDKYLNSMVSEYIFLIPTNDGLLTYVDPVSYGQTVTTAWEFHLDLSQVASKQLYADVFEVTVNEDGSITKLSDTRKTQVRGGTDNGVLKDRMEDMLDNIIVVEPYQPGKKYYRTKGRTFVKVEEQGGQFYVSGSWQDQYAAPMVAKEVYNMSNGIALSLDGVVMGTPKSVAKTLRDAVDATGDPVFYEFYSLVEACAVSISNGKDGWQAGDQEIGNLFNLKAKGAVGAEDVESNSGKATYLLNNYHYTVYAPTNEAMMKAYEAGLPTLDDLVEAEMLDDSLDIDASSPESNAGKILEVMLDFVKYHIQDNSLYIDEGFQSGEYETGKTEMIAAVNVYENLDQIEYIEGTDSVRLAGNATYKLAQKFDDGTITYYTGEYTPGRPYKLKVNVSANGMTVTDCRNGYDQQSHVALGGNTANVKMEEGLYNLMAREYWYDGGSKISNPWGAQINNSSAVVIHAIDAPLIYADGSSYDSNGAPVPTQFEYKYKPLAKQK